MATILLRRGTEAEIGTITLASGEIGLATDNLSLHLGNGVSNTQITDVALLDGSNADSLHTHTNLTLTNTGLHLLDTNASHDLIISPGSDLTADRTLTLTTGDADRTLTLSGNLTVPATGTAALLGTANVFTADQTIGDASGTSALILDANAANAADVRFAHGGTNAWIARSNLVTTTWTLQERTNNTDKIEVFPGTTGNLLLNQSGGYVGIGEADPDRTLHVNSGTSNVGLKFEVTDDGKNLFDLTNTAITWTVGLNTTSDYIISEDTAGNNPILVIEDGNTSTVLTVKSTGNVLIGTTTDSAQLAVDQSSSTGAQPVLHLNQEDTSEELIVASYGSADVDMRLLVLDNTAAAEFGWDDSEDAFTLSHDLDVNAQVIANSVAAPQVGFALDDATMVCRFDGSYPYETNFDVDTTGSHGQIATATNIIGRPGKFGKAVEIAEVTVNLHPNPAGASTTSWTNNSLTVISRVTYDAYVGGGCIEGASGGGQAYAQIVAIDIAPTATDPMTFQAMVKNVDIPDGGTLQMGVYWVGGANANAWGTGLQTVANIADLDDWTRVSISETPDYSDRTNAYLYFRFNGATADGQKALVDAVQAEAKPYATPFTYGDMNNSTWNGTAHASTSTRSSTNLEYPTTLLNDASGTIAMWLKMGSRYNGGNNTWAFSTSGRNNEVAFPRSAGSLTGQLSGYTNGNYWSWVTSDVLIPYDEWFHFATIWDGTNTYVYINGSLAYTRNESPLWTDTYLRIGGYSQSSSYRLNGLADDLVILDRALSADEVRAIYESNAPVSFETQEWRHLRIQERQGGDADDWTVTGTTDYPANFSMVQAGAKGWTGIGSGAGSVAVTFPEPYAKPPMVFITCLSRKDATVRPSSISTTGFTLEWQIWTPMTSVTSMDFNWIAYGEM